MTIFSDMSTAEKVYVTATDYFFLKDADISCRIIGGTYIHDVKWTIPVVNPFFKGLEDRLLQAGWQEVTWGD